MATLQTVPRPGSGSSITYIRAFPTSNRRPNVPDPVVVIGGQARQLESDELDNSPTKSPVKSLSLSTEDNLVQWDGPNDPENPQNWSARRKWLITIVAVITTVNVCVLISHLSQHRTDLEQERSHQLHLPERHLL